MNRYQKAAWYSLSVISATAVVTAAGIAVELRIRGYSTIAPWLFVGGLMLLKLSRFLFKKPQSPSGVVTDERDHQIVQKALAFAWMVFWWVFVGSCFLSFLLVGPRSSVPTMTLPLTAIGAGLFLKIVCSIAILVQYGRGDKGEES
jgi:hypothetical protein